MDFHENENETKSKEFGHVVFTNNKNYSSKLR